MDSLTARLNCSLGSAKIRTGFTLLSQHVNPCYLFQDKAAFIALFCIHRGHGAHLSRHWVHAIIAHGKVHVVVATVHPSTGLCGVVRLRLLGVDAVAAGDVGRLRPSVEVGTRLVAGRSSLVRTLVLGLGWTLVLLQHRALTLPHSGGQQGALRRGGPAWKTGHWILVLLLLLLAHSCTAEVEGTVV